MESYIDKIAELVIDEDKIVTYKSLSTSLGVHVNTAKQLLYTFLTKEKAKNSFPISATYLVAGKVVDGSFSITVVNEAELKNAQDSFVEVTSEHVYSVQKGKGLKELQVLCETDEESIKSANSKPVITSSNCVLLNPIAEENKRDVCKERKENKENNQKVVEKALLSEKPTVAPKEENKNVETAEKKESFSKSPKKPAPKGNQQKAQGNAKKTGGNIANLFAKVAQKNATKAASDGKANGNASRETAGVSSGDVWAKAVTGDTVEECEQEQTEKLEGRSESKESTSRKKKGNKRKRIRVLSDSEESDTNEEEEESEIKRVVEDETSPPRTIDIKDDEEKEEIKEFIPRNKRKKRKVIDKTVMHEDGYLETKKEIIFETDSEDEFEETAVAPAALKETQKPKAANDKGKGVQGASKKQSSLLSFFQKR